MGEEHNGQLKFVLMYVVVPAIILLLVGFAIFMVAYNSDKDEYEPTDTRGEDVYEASLFDEADQFTECLLLGEIPLS